MSLFLDSLRAAHHRGEYRNALLQSCREWKANRLPYAIENVVAECADASLFNELYSTLMDEDFRAARLAGADLNKFREDLHLGLSRIGQDRSRMVQYLHLLFLEQNLLEGEPAIQAHRRHCADYATFLQLDVPIGDRAEIGLHGVLHKFFPFAAGTAARFGDYLFPMVRLVDYEIGTWQCRCGAETGQARRYGPACGSCGTHVTLDLIWRQGSGTTSPADYRLPLFLILEIGERDSSSRRAPSRRIRARLLDVPIPLGLNERDGRLGFSLPGLLWLGSGADGRLVSLSDLPSYDRRDDALGVLQQSLRRTLLGGRGSYASFQGKLLEQLLRATRAATGGEVVLGLERTLTRTFASKIARNLGGSEGDTLLRFTAGSHECVVAVAPGLRDRMAVVNRDIVRPGALSALRQRTISVATTTEQEIVAEAGRAPGRRTAALDVNGIAAPGSTLQPGDLLADVRSKLSGEERMIRVIFGEPDARYRDVSPQYHGTQPAQVLEVTVDAEERPGGKQRRRISFRLAVEQPLEVGDTLVDGDGGSVVVCRILSSAAFTGRAGYAGAHLLVAPDHPWAPSAPDATTTTRVFLATPGGSPESTARGTGGYDILTSLPGPRGTGNGAAQVLAADDFRLLLGLGSGGLAFELYGPRGDVPAWRTELKELLLRSGQLSLTELTPASPDAHGLVRHWQLLLNAAGISATVGDDTLAFAPLTDDQMAEMSTGLVKTFECWDRNASPGHEAGLWCQAVFGPVEDWRCACGRYDGNEHAGIRCERCRVEVATSATRRTSLGYLKLDAPVVHTWYLDGSDPLLPKLLDMELGIVHELVACERVLVTRSPAPDLPVGSLPTWARWGDSYGGSALTGGAAVEHLLGAGRSDGVVLRHLPILPPVVRTRAGDATPDLPARYSAVLLANHQVRRTTGYPPVLRELQEAVDALLHGDGARSARPLSGGRRRPRSNPDNAQVSLGSLVVEAGNFLERPIDYSARGRLACGETPDIDTGLLPEMLAWELFAPQVEAELRAADLVASRPSLVSARQRIQHRTGDAYAALSAVAGRAMILVASGSGGWRPITLRVGLTGDAALTVSPELFDRIGWVALGSEALIFAVFSHEARADAAQLLPSAPPVAGGADSPAAVSVLDIPAAERTATLARYAADRLVLPLTCADRLLLGIPANR